MKGKRVPTGILDWVT